MENEKFIQALNLVVKARAFVYGQRLIEKIAKKEVFLVISCSDIGSAVQKKIKDKTTFYEIKYFANVMSVAELTKILHHQTPISAIGISDQNLAKLLSQTKAH